MPYVPKKKNVIPTIIIVIVIFVLITITSISFISQMISTPNEEHKFLLYDFDEETTIALLEEKHKDVIVIRDHFYYGESLNLFTNDYDVDYKDELAGKTIILKNLLNDHKISMTLENTIDSRLLVEELEEGFYQLYIIDDLQEKRLVYDESVDDVFHSVVRNDKVLEVRLLASNELLKDYDLILDHNYMYLDVKKVEPKADEIDVLIDPYGMNLDFTYLPDLGYQSHGLIENDEMYEAALLLKEDLQAYGLRVAISKKSKDEVGKTYGEEGHLQIGYDQKAKYYLFLRFNTHGSSLYQGLELAKSAYASNTLARTILYHVKQNTTSSISPMYHGNDAGIYPSLLVEGTLDQKRIYDENLYIRESGGRATLAGKYSQLAKEENGHFASLNGMYGIKVGFIYVSNEDDANYWKKNKEQLIQAIADGFALGIGLRE